MKKALRQRVLETIRQGAMMRAGDRVGVAVSGGADSVAMLHLLEELRDELGILLLVVHFNHRLRGAESDADEQFVAELAAAHGLEFLGGREDVAGHARKQGWNLEDAARRLRYQFFSDVVAAGRATRVAVGHTADDQAETVLARLIRGTGPLGLSAIYPVVGPVVRPLLGVRRQELREYLAALGQAWREDATNLDTSRLRARIRHSLVPQLERDFHGAAVAHLNDLAALAREDEAFWSELLDDRFRALVAATPEGLSIRIEDLLKPLPLAGVQKSEAQAAALTKRLIRRIVAALKGDRRTLTSRHVEQVIRLATESTSGCRIELPDGVVAERSLDAIIFRREGRAGVARAQGGGSVAARRAYEYVVDLPARGAVTICVPEIGRRISLKVIDWPAAASDTRKLGEALDAELLHPPLVLRNWQPGDAYRPRGRMRVRKLKRLLLERRVGARDRAGWPVLASAGRVVWARGLPAAQEFAARPGTKAGVLIAEEDL